MLLLDTGHTTTKEISLYLLTQNSKICCINHDNVSGRLMRFMQYFVNKPETVWSFTSRKYKIHWYSFPGMFSTGYSRFVLQPLDVATWSWLFPLRTIPDYLIKIYIWIMHHYVFVRKMVYSVRDINLNWYSVHQN